MAVLLAIVCVFTEINVDVQVKANGQYAFVMLYNIIYGFTWGPMPWLLPAEIFPLRGRSKGMALATTSNWIFNFIIGMVSPDAFSGIHGYFYLVIAGFCLSSAVLVHFYYVETAHHSLEEIAVAFGDKAFVDCDVEVMEMADAKSEQVEYSAWKRSDAFDCGLSYTSAFPLGSIVSYSKSRNPKEHPLSCMVENEHAKLSIAHEPCHVPLSSTFFGEGIGDRYNGVGSWAFIRRHTRWPTS